MTCCRWQPRYSIQRIASNDIGECTMLIACLYGIQTDRKKNRGYLQPFSSIQGSKSYRKAYGCIVSIKLEHDVRENPTRLSVFDDI